MDIEIDVISAHLISSDMLHRTTGGNQTGIPTMHIALIKGLYTLNLMYTLIVFCASWH